MESLEEVYSCLRLIGEVLLAQAEHNKAMVEWAEAINVQVKELEDKCSNG